MSDTIISNTSSDGYSKLVTQLLDDARHGWSIGVFGAVGEFIRDSDERLDRHGDALAHCLVTPRAAIRVLLNCRPLIVPYDTLSSDGETWGHSVAFCLPLDRSDEVDGIREMGPDVDAVCADDRDARLFDLGVGIGRVRFCLRTRDVRLIEVLRAMQGQSPFSAQGGELMTETLRAQPHRIALSPAGRIEVYADIPPPDGASPEGPHTHLLPKLLQTGRTHDANAPIPEGYQPVLHLSPRSPWRDGMGRATPYDEGLDRDFLALLKHYGSADEARITAEVEKAIAAGIAPDAFEWPDTRRGRAVARLTLRRLAQRAPGDHVTAWRRHFDRADDASTE